MSHTSKLGGTADSAAADCAGLSPPRFTWLRRSGVAAVAAVVGLIVLRVVWGIIAQHRLNAQLAEYRAAKQPVYVSEFNAELDAVPEHLNAAIPLEKAMEAFVPTVVTPDGEFDAGALMKQAADSERLRPAADQLMQANAETLRLIREARDLPEVAWSWALSPDTTNIPYGQFRGIAKFLWFAADYHFRDGHGDEAVGVLRDSLVFNQAVDSEPTLLSCYVAWGSYNLSFRLLEEFLDQLEIGTVEDSGVSVSPVLRKDVESLLRDLLAEDSMRWNIVRCHFGSRAIALHSLETMSVADYINSRAGVRIDSPRKQMLNAAAHPVLVLDTARELRFETIAAAASQEASWPKAKRCLSANPPEAKLLCRLARPLTRTQFGPAESAIRSSAQLFFRVLSRRRMAAIAVAIRLYEVDHGHRPTGLADLAPAYLPELARDPFSAAGETFRYKPEADRPILYSVGPDGQDNDGREVRDGPRIDRERSDIPFYLKPEAVPASAGQADDDDQDVEDDAGNHAEEDPGQPDPD